MGLRGFTCISVYIYIHNWFYISYPVVIKHGNGESPKNGGFSWKITEKWSMFHCYVCLPEGTCFFPYNHFWLVVWNIFPYIRNSHPN